MSDFLESLKADLTSRRLLALVGLATVGLVVALVYALNVSNAPVRTPTAVAPASTGPASLTVQPASTSSDQAVAETANGTAYQHGGQARDPFAPLASTATTTTTTTPTAATPATTTGGTTSTSSTSTTATGSGEQATTPTTTQPQETVTGGGAPATSTTTTPTTTPTPTATPTPTTTPKTQARKTVYHVQAEFGPTPAAGQAPQLTSFSDLKRGQALPVAPAAPVVVFAGVLEGGSEAVFKLVGEAFPGNGAACIPSAIQCEALKLSPGHGEQLEYRTAEGQPTTYTLEVVTITKVSATAAAAARAYRYESPTGKKLLGHGAHSLTAGLRYSLSRGVLVAARKRRSR